MNILLTGGTGYIGSHAAIILINAGYNVVLYDNLCNSKKDVVHRLEKITAKNIVFVEGDLCDTKLLSRIIKENNIDAVMHFAGLKAVGESCVKPLEYFDNNINGTISLLKAMKENSLKTLVFTSSATVYGTPLYLPIDELHPTSATNPYGRTKLHIEEMLQDISESDENWRVMCLRYFNPVGAHESGLVGEDPQGIPNNLIPFVSLVAAGKQAAVRVFGGDYPTEDGTGVRDYIHIIDLVEGHLAAIKFLKNHSGWHAINLGTGQGSSVLEMINTFASVAECPIPYNIESRRSGDVAICYASVKKAGELLGWRAKKNLQQMCFSAWCWQKSNM